MNEQSNVGGTVTRAEELKPCPFCGGADVMEYYDHYETPIENMSGWLVSCGNCAATTGTFEAVEAAIAAWNRRP